MTSRSQQTKMRRWLLPFLAALIAALAAILFGTTASASATVGAETRVGAFHVVGEVPSSPRNTSPQVSAHAAERIVYGTAGRSPTTLSRVDDILNNPTRTMMRPNGTIWVYQGKRKVV